MIKGTKSLLRRCTFIIIPVFFIIYYVSVDMAISKEMQPYFDGLPYYPEEIRQDEKTIAVERCKTVIDHTDEAAKSTFNSMRKMNSITFGCGFILMLVLCGIVWKRDNEIKRLREEEAI